MGTRKKRKAADDGRTTLVIGTGLLAALRARARRADMSASAVVRQALRRLLGDEAGERSQEVA